MMHIRAAFQIFKEMLNNTEAKNTGSSGNNVKPDMGDLGIVEPTGMKTLQARVNDLQYQVQTSNLTHFYFFSLNGIYGWEEGEEARFIWPIIT